MANTKFTRAVKKAKGLYKTGRYKTFADAVKAAYKKIGSVGAAKKKKSTRQTGTSNKRYDIMRKAKTPGKRRSASGRTYTERRKNRSDAPGSLTGVSAAALTRELISKQKDKLSKQLLKRELTTGKLKRRKITKEISQTKSFIKRLQ